MPLVATAVTLMLGLVVGAAAVAALVPAAHAHEHVATLEIVIESGRFQAVDFSGSGQIAVVNSRDDRVRIFYPDGTFAFDLDGQFNHPFDVGFGPSGQIAVADNYNHTVQVFHPNGTFDFNFGSYGFATGSFYYPQQVDIGPSGQIAVSDGSGRVQIFDPNGRFVHILRVPGVSSVEFEAVRDVEFGPGGLLAVVDNDPSGQTDIEVFHLNGTHSFRISDAFNMYGVAFGPDGVIAAAAYEGRARTVVVYHPNGTIALKFNSWSSHDSFHGAFSDVSFGPLGRLAAVDEYRVVVFNITSLTTVEPWRPELTLPAPPAMTPMPTPPAAVPPALSLTGMAHAFEVGSVGAGPGEFFDPAGIAFGPGGVFAVADSSNHRVQVFHANGTFAFEFGGAGRDSGEFFRPYDVAFGPGGLLAVSDMGNGRVQVFRVQ